MPVLTSRLHASATARAWWYRRSWPVKAAVGATTVAAGSLISAAGGYPPLVGAALTAAVLAAVVAWLTASEIVTVCLVGLVYLTVAGPIGYAYTSAALGLGPAYGDLLGGTLNLTLLTVLAAAVSWRASRGRAWVTLAFALIATVVPGMALLWSVPLLGLWWAWLCAGLALAARCGLWSWAWSLRGLRAPRPAVAVTRDESALAARWPESDPPALVRRISAPGSGVPVDLALDHAGARVVATVRAPRRARRNSEHGLLLPGEAMQALAASLIAGQRRAARLTGVPRRDIGLLVLLEHPSNADVDACVGLHPDGSPVPVALVRMVGRDRFAPAISERPTRVWAGGRVRKTAWLAVSRLSGRAVRRPSRAQRPAPSSS